MLLKLPQPFVGAILLLAWATAGCSRYNMAALRNDLAMGNYKRAFATLEKNTSKSPHLPSLYELGLVSHYANEFERSHRAFELAERISDDLYTRSLSREAAALLTSDNTRPYAGTRYEQLLLHYYRALNYVYQNEPDEALVEVRRASALLRRFADEDPTFHFGGAAFLAYFGGILYEWADEVNDAYIAYRWAEVGYDRYREQLGVLPPKELGEALVRLARQLGFDDDATRHLQRYGEPPKPSPNEGELLLFYETGYIPQKQEENLFFPILKSDPIEEKRVWEFADALATRRHVRVEDASLEYLLRIAVPTYGTNRPRFRGIEASVNGISAKGVLVEDLEAVAKATFASEQGHILTRTLARALLKYLAYRRVRKVGDFAGFLMNVFNVATERADTRAWETLPNQIHLLRLWLPEGEHTLRLTFTDENGNPLQTRELHHVPIRAREKTLLNYRTFE